MFTEKLEHNMAAFYFRFEINQSFLGYPGHPITIPKGEVDYKRLQSEQLHQGEFIVVFPRGERLTAKMYHGDAGYGPYYQLKLTGDDRNVPRYIEAGKGIYVLLVRMDAKNYAILEQVLL